MLSTMPLQHETATLQNTNTSSAVDLGHVTYQQPTFATAGTSSQPQHDRKQSFAYHNSHHRQQKHAVRRKLNSAHHDVEFDPVVQPMASNVPEMKAKMNGSGENDNKIRLPSDTKTPPLNALLHDKRNRSWTVQLGKQHQQPPRAHGAPSSTSLKMSAATVNNALDFECDSHPNHDIHNGTQALEANMSRNVAERTTAHTDNDTDYAHHGRNLDTTDTGYDEADEGCSGSTYSTGLSTRSASDDAVYATAGGCRPMFGGHEPSSSSLLSSSPILSPAPSYGSHKRPLEEKHDLHALGMNMMKQNDERHSNGSSNNSNNSNESSRKFSKSADVPFTSSSSPSSSSTMLAIDVPGRSSSSLSNRANTNADDIMSQNILSDLATSPVFSSPTQQHNHSVKSLGSPFLSPSPPSNYQSTLTKHSNISIQTSVSSSFSQVTNSITRATVDDGTSFTAVPPHIHENQQKQPDVNNAGAERRAWWCGGGGSGSGSSGSFQGISAPVASSANQRGTTFSFAPVRSSADASANGGGGSSHSNLALNLSWPTGTTSDTHVPLMVGNSELDSNIHSNSHPDYNPSQLQLHQQGYPARDSQVWLDESLFAGGTNNRLMGSRRSSVSSLKLSSSFGASGVGGGQGIGYDECSPAFSQLPTTATTSTNNNNQGGIEGGSFFPFFDQHLQRSNSPPPKKWLGPNPGAARSTSTLTATPWQTTATASSTADLQSSLHHFASQERMRPELGHEPSACSRIGDAYQAYLPDMQGRPRMPSLAEQDAMSGQLSQFAKAILQPYETLDVHSKVPEPNALKKLSSRETEEAYAHALRDYEKDFGLMARNVPLLQEYNCAQLVYYYYHVFKLSPAYTQFKRSLVGGEVVEVAAQDALVPEAAGALSSAGSSTDILASTVSSLSSVAGTSSVSAASVDVGVGTTGAMLSRATSPCPKVVSARLLLSSKRARNIGTTTPAPPAGVVD